MHCIHSFVFNYHRKVNELYKVIYTQSDLMSPRELWIHKTLKTSPLNWHLGDLGNLMTYTHTVNRDVVSLSPVKTELSL